MVSSHSISQTQEVRESARPPILNPVLFLRAADCPGFWASGPEPRRTHFPQQGGAIPVAPRRPVQTVLSPSTCQPQFRFPCTPVGELGASTAGGPDRVSVSGLDRICPQSPSHPTLPQVLSVKSEELRPKEQVLAGTEVRQLVNSAPQEAWR